MADLDAIRQAIEERDAALRQVDDLAKHMEYRGNSVSWIYSKQEKYSRALDDAWKALNEAGIVSDGEMDVAAGIRLLASRVRTTTEPK